MKRKHPAAIGILVIAAAVLCLALLRPGVRPAGIRVLVDGKEFTDTVLSPENRESLRIIVTLDGTKIADLPFGEPHTVRFLQDNGDENTLLLTEKSVRMESANCEGQDCVHMEEVTRENLETRVMFGMIICLPHRLSVEVR